MSFASDSTDVHDYFSANPLQGEPRHPQGWGKPQPLLDTPVVLLIRDQGTPRSVPSRGCISLASSVALGGYQACHIVSKRYEKLHLCIMQRIIRPTGGVNKWLHFLPISLHKIVDQVLRNILSNTTFTTLFQGKLLAPYPVSNVHSFGLSSVLEADTNKIVTVVRDTFEK